MIPRYTRPEMAALWSEQSRFQIWLDVETVALKAMVKHGLAPQEAYQAVKEKGAFDIARVNQLELELKHDVIAFLTNVSENAGQQTARYLHRGMTSSDLIDTSFAIQLRKSAQLLLLGLEKLMATVKERAQQHKFTPCMGRSHGIHAEPITFGLKLAGWYAELARGKERLLRALDVISYGKISGAVGTYQSLNLDLEREVLEVFELKPETVSTQVVPRDRHAEFFATLALIATAIERLSVEVRHLQRSEVREAEEYFSAGQKGSSAMPHKRNPILSENLCGLARLVRSYAQAALENVVLWHERDISHSSVERVIAPDACVTLDFMLARANSLVAGLVVHKDRMLQQLESTRGLVFSGTLLLALVDHGVSREDAYRMVQRHALEAWDGGPELSERVKRDAEITAKIPEPELNAVFDLSRHFKHVDAIFERTFK